MLFCWLKKSVIGVDLSYERVDLINAGKSPFLDVELSKYLKSTTKFPSNTNLQEAVVDADYVIVSTPTNYNEIKIFLIQLQLRQLLNKLLNWNQKLV